MNNFLLVVYLCVCLNVALVNLSRVKPCKYYENDKLVKTKECPKKHFFGSRYLCGERRLNVTTKSGVSAVYHFCDTPFGLGVRDACLVKKGDKKTGDAGSKCPPGETCDAGPIDKGIFWKYKLYFCGSVPKHPNYVRKMGARACEVKGPDGSMIKTKTCWLDAKCIYGPVNVIDKYGVYGKVENLLSMKFCTRNTANFNPLKIF